jgi:hypothetical protein
MPRLVTIMTVVELFFLSPERINPGAQIVISLWMLLMWVNWLSALDDC